MSCGVGHRCGSDPSLLCLWCRPADTTPIQPLAWELTYATGAALKRPKKKKKADLILTYVLLKLKNHSNFSERRPTKDILGEKYFIIDIV